MYVCIMYVCIMYVCMYVPIDDLITKRSFDSHAIALTSYTWVLKNCTTRHWQTPGQLVQELHVCTVETVACACFLHNKFVPS